MRRLVLGLLLLLALARGAAAQTVATRITSGGTLPTSCTVGNIWIKTGASAGLYSCVTTNTWTGPYSITTGTVTTTGSPASGNLAKFSGASSITSGDLAGDCTTSGTLTCTIPNNTVTYGKMQDVTAASKLLGRGSAAGSGDPQEITVGSGLSMSGTTLSATAGARTAVFGFVIDGGSNVILTGFKGCTAPFPEAGTITKWTILSVEPSSPTTGSVTLDLWKDTYGNYVPTVTDTLIGMGGTKPNISSSTTAQSSSLSNWTTAISANDIVCVNVDSVSSFTKILLAVEFTVP